MLTKHNYQKTETDLQEGKIFDCCRKDVPGDSGCEDCCYDSWKDELKRVNQSYSETVEKCQQIKNSLSFIIDRRNKFKTWLDELLKAEDLVKKICNQLEIIASQSDKIWFNSGKAVEAIEIVFCMIRDFYMRVDYIKKRYDELQACINANNDSSLVKGQGLLKCLEDYYAKLDGVIKTRDEIIKLAVEAIKISNLLRNHISTNDVTSEFDPCNPGAPCNCSTDGPSYYGFKTIICEWYCSFGCDEECVPCADKTTQPTQASSQKQVGSGIKDAKPSEACELEPMFEFPICNDEYKCRVEKWYKADEQNVKDLSEELMEITKEKESLQACKSSLERAIAEVDPKKRCK